jgi:putative hydrolase of the HAD superfamily
MAWDLGNVLSLVDEGPPTRAIAEISGRTEHEVFEAVFSPDRKAMFESGLIDWRQQYACAAKKLGLALTVEEFTAIFNSAMTPNAAVFPLVEEMLGQIRCAVASNTSEAHWTLERKRLPFGTRLQPEAVSYRVGAMKPDPKFFLALCHVSGVAPDRIVFTDDREDNVAGAASVGITALLYRGHQQLRLDLRPLGFRV